MASINLREQRDAFINSMMAEGLLDDQFNQLLMLEDDQFLAEVITLFCDDSEKIISELSKLLDPPAVEYQKVDGFVHQLKGSSSSVGAHNIKIACIHFRQSCEEKDRLGCMRALNMVNSEYYRIKGKFSTLVQLLESFN